MSEPADQVLDKVKRPRPETGDTMVEVLIAIVILGIAGVALLVGFATSITASAQHRQLATLDSSIRTATSEAIAQVQSASDAAFTACPTAYHPTLASWKLPPGFSVTSYSVQYWNGTTFSSTCPTTSTTPPTTITTNPQLWTITVASSSGKVSPATVTTVIYDPQPPNTSGGSTPAKIVFLQPTAASPGTGTVNAPLSPQPIVAVEDATNEIVYSDASSMSLSIAPAGTGGSITSGSGTLSNCSAVENDGVFAFGGCSISATGSYSLTATDTDSNGLTTSTFAPYTVSKALQAKLAFTSTPSPQTASNTASAGTNAITVSVEDSAGNPDPGGAVTVSLGSTSSTGLFWAGTTNPLTQVTSVTIPANATSATFYYSDTTAGQPSITGSDGTLLQPTAALPVTINPGPASKVTITPSVNPTSASATTNTKLTLQLTDSFGNATTSTTSTALTVSTSSTKGFFNTATGGTGTLGGAASVTIAANGTGTATEWYGDETAATPTITAKLTSSGATWGMTTVTITAKTTGDTLSVVSGTPQNTTVGTAFGAALVVKDLDQFNNPVSGVTVTFATPGSGASGTFSGGATVTTNTSGVATSNAFSANTTSGTYNVSASAPGATPALSFAMTNNAGPTSNVSITPSPSTASTSATTNIKLSLQLTDQYGNGTTSSGTTNLVVSTSSTKGFFNAATGGTGALGGTATVSFANGAGTATEWYGDEAAATPTITAKLGTNTGPTWGTTSLTITAKTTGDTLSVVSGTPQNTAVGTAFGAPFVVSDVDQFNNPVSGVTVTFAAPGSGASGTFSGGATATTNALGVATSNAFSANTTSGTYNVSASAPGATPTLTFSMTNNVGPASKVTIAASPNSVPALGTTNVTLNFQLTDQFGNNATSAGTTSLTVGSSSAKGFFSASNGGTGTLGAATTVTFANGAGTATAHYGDETAATPTITAQNGTTTWGTTTVQVTAGQATLAVISPTPSTASASATTNVKLNFQLVDQFGNNATSTGTTSLVVSTSSTKGFFNAATGGPGTLGGTATVSFANGAGTATEWYGDETAATPTITAKNGAAPWGTTTVTITAKTTGDTLSIVSGTPQNTTVGTGFTNPLVVADADQFGNPVSGVTVTFSAPGTGATGTFGGGATATTNALGVGTSNAFSANTTSGTYNVSASAPGATPTLTFAMTNNAGAATTIAISSGSGQSATVASAFANPLAAKVTDQYGNAVSGVTVTFAPPGTGASGTFTTSATALTNASGVATSNTLTANTTAGGPYNVAASTTGTNTVNFAETNTAKTTGDTVSIVSGTPQNTAVGSAFTGALVVKDLDQYGNPVPGITVTFTVPGSGASGTFSGGATATTNASGVATSNTFTANTTSGAYSVTATAPGATPTLTFALTNNVGAPKTIAISSGSGQSATVASAFTNPLAAKVTDQFGNAVPGATVTFAPPVTGASGTFTTSATATTNASGVATSNTFTANTISGAYNVAASAPGTNSVNFAETNTAKTTGDTVSIVSGTPQNTTVGSAFGGALVVKDLDQYGNPVPGITVTFTAPGTGASGTFSGGATATTNASGVATSNALTANTTPGAYSVTAAAPGATPTLTFALTNNVGAPTTIAVTSGNGQSATVNTNFSNPLAAKVTDQYGNAVSGVTVTFTPPATGASGTFTGGATASTNASGVATSNTFKASTTAGGPYNVTASASGTNTVSFPETNVAGSPNTISLTSGSPQSTIVGTAFANPLVATVTDQYNNLLSGVTVTFAPPATGASGTFSSGTTATTNASGVATSSTFTANATVGGPYNVSATAPGTNTINFSFTNQHAITVTSVASGTGTSSIQTGNFAMTSGTTYLIAATASNNTTITPSLSTISGSPATHLIATNTFNVGGNNCRDSNNCYQWAWWFTATNSATTSITLNLTNTPTAAVLDVMALGSNSSTPIAQNSTNSGSNRVNSGNRTTTVTAALTNDPANSSVTLQLLGSDDTIGTTGPAWSPDNSNVYFKNSTAQPGASLDVNLSPSGQQSETTNTNGTGYGGNQDWGTITLEIGHS